MIDIQAHCATAARTCVGHPFNPPYLVPFVEVVGGEHSDPEVVDWVEPFILCLEFRFYHEMVNPHVSPASGMSFAHT